MNSFIKQALESGNAHKVLTSDELRIAFGMAFGIRGKRSEIDNAMQDAGLTHILVFSGANVSMLLHQSTLLIPQRIMRFKIQIQIFILLLILITIGVEPSTLRAVIMSASHIISKKIGRRASAWHSTILTGLLMLCIDPRLIYNISFQLSFGAVIGIGLFYQEIDIENKLLEYLYNSTLMTISASALTIPIIYFYFDRISYVSTIANTLISWLISPQILLTYTTVVIEKIGISVMLTNCMYYFLKVTTNIIIKNAILMAKLNKQVSILLDQQ